MEDRTPSIRIIVPVRNEAQKIHKLLDVLKPHADLVLLVDGGSNDETVTICQQQGFSLISSQAGRARQMNAGARYAQADYYWFLHADCLPPNDAIEQILNAAGRGYQWGRFNVRLTGHQPVFRLVERFMNWRSCITQVATGDQGLFVSHALFQQIGGFPDIPLMEDIAVSKRLRRHGRGACLSARLEVSSRRWESRGIYRTILLMWWLRLRYVMGADPIALHRAYYG